MYEEIHQLVLEARAGDQKAIKRLQEAFNPLILKTSRIIYERYKHIASISEIVEQARQCFLCLTLMEYNPDGPAFYPAFIKKQLHARLVQTFRPMFINQIKTRQIFISTVPQNISDNAIKHEKEEICEKLMMYINDKCNDREKDIIIEFICNNVPRVRLAEKYHISKQRMKYIHRRIIGKLKKYLSKLGIKRLQDI